MRRPRHKLCLAIALAVALPPGSRGALAIAVKGGLSAAREYGDYAPENHRLGVFLVMAGYSMQR